MELMPKEKYYYVEDTIKNLPFNNLFARAVVENFVNGKIYVDQVNKPSYFYLVHPYGMSLLIHTGNKPNINTELMTWLLAKVPENNIKEWIQIFPLVLEAIVDHTIKHPRSENKNVSVKKNNQLKKLTRINFKFNKYIYNLLKRRPLENHISLQHTSKKLFDAMEGTVVPKRFWDSAFDFEEKAIGFSLLYKDELGSTAFAAFRVDNFLELGMETLQKFRNKGFGTIVCMKLIDYCIENGYEPVWACSQNNTASMQLAIKLGFEPVNYLPYYELSQSEF
jgi:GNAT superfamily N-acetyltransferase